MTDEEKAEEYATEDLPDGYTKINYVKKQAYLDGMSVYKNILYKLIEIIYSHESKDFRDEISLESYTTQTMEKIINDRK